MENNQSDQIPTIKNEIDETRALLIRNAERLIERDNHLATIESNSENLARNSTQFRRRTRDMSRTMLLKKNYCTFVVIFIIFFFFLMFLLIYMGSKSNKNN